MAKISKRGRKSHKAGRQIKTLDQLKRLFEQQKPKMEMFAITSQDGEKEVFVHCIDTMSFNGKRYCPNFAISSFGRVWSLEKSGFYNEYRKNAEGYRKIHVGATGKKINPNKNVYVHELVAAYFCDQDQEQRNLILSDGITKTVDDIHVHHIMLYALNFEDYSIDKWTNLQFISEDLHSKIHTMLRARKEHDPQKRERKLKNLHIQTDDELFSMLLNAYALGSNKYNGLKVTYKKEEDGRINKCISITQRFNPSRPKTMPENSLNNHSK